MPRFALGWLREVFDRGRLDQIDGAGLGFPLVDKARSEGVELVGSGGMLTGLTKSVLETALEAEMTERLGYDEHDPAGRGGENSPQ